ncbi:MAG: class IIb bacteriocin, lactobin A/cerein 7B family [Prevotella sp.]|jgi:lactobin A/cerein 7B family class IIb bacteriocin|nr:class IIb bacteriocin, lactobin A/cerein 7B family [Prevotella sp.]
MENLRELTQKELVETSGGCWLCAVAICAGIAYAVGKILDLI